MLPFDLQCWLGDAARSYRALMLTGRCTGTINYAPLLRTREAYVKPQKTDILLGWNGRRAPVSE